MNTKTPTPSLNKATLCNRKDFCKGGISCTLMSVIPSTSPFATDKDLKAIEMFAGIGGFKLACDKLGIKTVWANDINEKAVKVYRDRFGENSIIQGDINNLIDDIPPHNILTGGFPCQPFSRAGKKMGIDDIRGTLFEAIVKTIKIHRPNYFFLENVNSLLFLDNGRHFRTILFALSELGYKIEWRVFNAVAFGLPQQRLRVIISGCKNGKRLESFFITESELTTIPQLEKNNIADNWKPIETSKGKFQQWGMAYKGKYTAFDIDPTRNIVPERKLHDILESNVGDEFDFTENTKKRIEKSEFVNKFYNGVQILYNQGHGARMGYTIFGTDGIAPTLTASASRHYERYKINGRYRRLTNVEYARLQGFPDDHCSAVSVYEQYRLYGNAVPPQLVEYAMKRVLENKVVTFSSNSQSLFPEDDSL